MVKHFRDLNIFYAWNFGAIWGCNKGPIDGSKIIINKSSDNKNNEKDNNDKKINKNNNDKHNDEDK